MNKRNALAMAAALATFAAAPAAMAADGTIDFTGEVTTNTCVVNGGANTPMTVTLPRINTAQLTGHGDTAAQTRFVIRVAGCATGGPNNARAFFEANGTNVDYTNNALRNIETGANLATGVGFALFNESDRARINIGQHVNHGTSWVPMTAAGIDLGYEVSYVQMSPMAVGAGRVRGQVQYSIEYN